MIERKQEHSFKLGVRNWFKQVEYCQSVAESSANDLISNKLSSAEVNVLTPVTFSQSLVVT